MMKLKHIVGCENTWYDSVSSIQLKLADSVGNELELDSLGAAADAQSQCSSMVLTGDEFVRRIEATYNTGYIETVTVELDSGRNM